MKIEQIEVMEKSLLKVKDEIDFNLNYLKAIKNNTEIPKTEEKNDGKISKYFSENETTVSATGSAKGIENTPTAAEKKNIVYAAERLDKFREFLDIPFYVLSWFRCEKLNNAVKGSKTSAHRFGLAIDIYSSKMSAKQIYDKVKASNLSYDQLIYYPKQNFVHIGFKLDQKSERKQAFLL